MVYVDWLMKHGWIFRGRTIESCHLYADSVGELEDFAEKIGLKRIWLQEGKPYHLCPHFDLTPAKRELAIRFGARAFNGNELSGFLRKDPVVKP